MPSAILQNKSLYELLFKAIPFISHLSIFGCACFPLLRPYILHKLQPKTQMCVFLGYASQYKGYICYDVPRKCTYISRHVIFNEIVFPFPDLIKHNSLSSTNYHPSYISFLLIVTKHNVITRPPPSVTLPSLSVSSHSESVAVSSHVSSLPILSQTVNSASSPQSITTSSSFSAIPVALALNNEGMSTESLHSVAPFNLDGLSMVLHFPSMNLHLMQTRSKTGTIKQKATSPPSILLHHLPLLPVSLQASRVP